MELLLLAQVKYGQTMKDGTDETKVNLGVMLKINQIFTVEGDSNGDELISRPNP